MILKSALSTADGSQGFRF